MPWPSKINFRAHDSLVAAWKLWVFYLARLARRCIIWQCGTLFYWWQRLLVFSQFLGRVLQEQCCLYQLGMGGTGLFKGLHDAPNHALFTIIRQLVPCHAVLVDNAPCNTFCPRPRKETSRWIDEGPAMLASDVLPP